MRLIDADALERMGYVLTRTYQLDKETMVYETKKLSDVPSAQPTQTNADSTHENTLDCVSREEVLDAIDEYILGKPEGCTIEARELLKLITKVYHMPIYRMSSAQPRKNGKWTNHRNDDGHNIADCDQCENAIQWFDGDEIPRYCCMCGADMRSENDED